MLEELRERLVNRIRDLALHDNVIAGIMNEIFDYDPTLDDSGAQNEMGVFYCNAESAIICEIVK